MIFLCYRTCYTKTEPAEDSQGHKLSSHLDKNSDFRLFHGQKCMFMNSITLRLIFFMFSVELFQNFYTSRFVRPCSIRIDAGQNLKKIQNNFTRSLKNDNQHTSSKLLESIALPTKDNVIKDNHGKWSIEETCDNVKLESFHPLLPGGEKNFLASELFIFTHECDKNQIVYFKSA